MGYNYDHDCPFEAFITNLGKYNEGELVGEWVKFPTTPEQLKEVFERIGIGTADEFGNVYEEWFITDYDCYVDKLYDMLGEYENLDELNYLASKIEELDDSEWTAFQAAIEMGEHCGSVKDLINLTDNTENYSVIAEVENHYDLGYYYIHEVGGFDLDSMGPLANYIDYESYGRDIAMDATGDFISGGYVYDNRNQFTADYDGNRENIPEEYRVMVSPEEPELSHEEQMELDGAMLDEATGFALDMDVLLRVANEGYASAYPEFHERQEDIADSLMNGNYTELKDLLSPVAKSQGEHAPAAAELMERMSTFDDEFIGKDSRMLTASMELAADIDQFFRGFDVEYGAMFPDENVQQIVLHEHLYKGDTSGIMTGLVNMGRERDLAEETAPLVEQLEGYEKEFGINTYLVYQLKQGPEYREYRFEGMEALAAAGLSVEPGNYELVYTAPLTPGETLESIYQDLNLDRPDNFHGHSLSVSDVVVLREYGKETAHYCDSMGFQEILEFLELDNPLKNAEMAVEDDCGMIDGIINNGERNEEKAHQAEKPSVLRELLQAIKECAQRKPPEIGKPGKEEPEL